MSGGIIGLLAGIVAGLITAALIERHGRRVSAEYRRAHRFVTRFVESLSHNELRERLDQMLHEQFGTSDDTWVWIRDINSDEGWVVFDIEAPGDMASRRISFTVGDDDTVTLTGDASEVQVRTSYEPVREAVDHLAGHRVLARRESTDGNRVFRVEMLRYGTSENGRRYPADVMQNAARLYEGARAFDHHRTEEELRTSTVSGLCGFFRNVEATEEALEADFHILPSATHVAEALDASLDAQAHGLPALCGFSHDVLAAYRPVVESGRRLLEATQIATVNSVDVVAQPAAGGRVTRMVAGGTGTTPINHPSEEDTTMTLAQLLQLLRDADATRRAELLQEHASVLEDAGIASTDIGYNTDGTTLAPEPDPESAPDPEPALAGAGTERGTEARGGHPAEQTFRRDSLVGEDLISRALDRALAGRADQRLVEAITPLLPERFTEAQLVAEVERFRVLREAEERAGLRPGVADTRVTSEERDRLVESLDAMFDAGNPDGFRSIKAAWRAFEAQTNPRVARMGVDDVEPEQVVRAVAGAGFDSRFSEAERGTESVSAATFAQALGDSITRRMIAEYSLEPFGLWRQIVSNIESVNDFREQKLTRVGGYGELPAVAERGPYQPLDTPDDEQETYTLAKKGGTEDWSLEAIANDDMRLVRNTPRKLGRAAGLGLHNFVFGTLLADNPTLGDSVALFHTSHNNTDTSAGLANSTVSTGRRKMRSQSQLSASGDVLGATLLPRFLLVPNELEEAAFRICTSAVAVPASGESSDMPNLHQRLTPLVIDTWTDANDWMLIADPRLAPTIEIGFYRGRQEPELFVQDQANVGGVFSADVITWKIRHIYSGTVLDFRSAYRGQG